MGQAPSMNLGRRSSGRSTLRSPFLRRSKLNTSDLSHTFNMSSIDRYADLLNINIATEEQLMTLPGINRQVAQAIVEHRQVIGRFKRVDDLALVSGIGAEKLNLLRGEICTSRRLPSRAGSRAPSLDSLRSSGDSVRPRLELNRASVFQLQCVPGLNQELAANILDHRQAEGPFRSLDELAKVHGLDALRVDSLKRHLCLDSHRADLSADASDGNFKIGNGSLKFNSSNVPNESTPRTPGRRKTLSIPMKYSMNLINGFATVPVDDIYELLSAYSYRPIIEEDFMYARDGRRAVRIATWNIHRLDVDKANNPGFREVFCCTLLENRVSIVCLQGVLEEGALKIIVDELNLPSLRRVQEKRCNSRRWQMYVAPAHQASPSLAFLYDTECDDMEIQLKNFRDYTSSISVNGHMANIVEAVDNLPSKLSPATNVAIVSFNILNFLILVVNIHLESKSTEEDISIINAVWQMVNDTNQNALLLGDFHNLEKFKGIEGARRTIGEEAESEAEASAEGGRAQLASSSRLGAAFTGRGGAVRDGLHHMAIPRGWSWGGAASPHRPLWAEFFLR